MALMDPADPRFHLGHADIDGVHAEFIALANAAAAADAAGFPAAFAQLVAHTTEHFAGEEAMMAQSAYPATDEHRGEHGRVLAEMRQLDQRAQAGRTMMARAYVKERLPDWFALHTATMDSALVAHLAKA